MDIERSQPSGAKASNPVAVSSQSGDQKELAWAFLGLLLWSAVVFGAIFGVGYVLGHSLLHWW